MKKFFVFLFALILCGCGGSPKKHQLPLVVVSIPPYIEMVEAIAGDSFRVEAAIPATYNIHTSEATPRMVETIQQADLWIGIGEVYEKKILTALKEAKSETKVLELYRHIPLLTYSDDTRGLNVCEHDHHGLADEGKDLHFWMSPKRLGEQAKLIAAALIDLNPAKEDDYKSNLERYLEKVKRLDGKIEKMLAPYKYQAIITSHAALGYFCHDYKLTQIAIECEGKSPLPQTIDRLVAVAKNGEARSVFIFPGHDNKGALMIGEQLGLQTYEINPLDEKLLVTLEKLASDIAKGKKVGASDL